MNLSSERSGAASYAPLEYREAGDPPDVNTASETATEQPPAVPQSLQPDPATLFAARLEEQRRTITAQAHQEAEREIQRARSEIARSIEDFGQQREKYFRQCEAEVVDLALAIARRIIHRETQIDPRLLASLVNYELEQLDAATSVRLIVAPGSLGYWNEAAAGMSRTVEVSVDKALASGDVRMETVLGNTSVNFERELKEIERGFLDLLSHRPAPSESRAVRVQ
jgi:flagellar assembly protein FliH